MKKLCLLFTLVITVQPVLSTTYYYQNLGPQKVYTNTSIKTKNISNSASSAQDISPDMLFLQGLLAGTTLYTGRLNVLATPALARNGISSYLDPYIVTINGHDYVLVIDSKNGEWSVENILGNDDSKDDLFASLKKLESDKDSSKITQKELKNANIRFVLLKSDGSLALDEKNLDYDLNNVQYIDMKNLRTALGNKNEDGTFGYFYVHIKENGKKRAVPGRVTFEEKNELNKYVK